MPVARTAITAVGNKQTVLSELFPNTCGYSRYSNNLSNWRTNTNIRIFEYCSNVLDSNDTFTVNALKWRGSVTFRRSDLVVTQENKELEGRPDEEADVPAGDYVDYDGGQL